MEQSVIMRRIIIGKTLGGLIGGLGWVMLTLLDVDVTTRFKVALLLWYMLLGAVVAMQSMLSYHSILKVELPWWLGATVIGAWLNLILLLFIEPQIIDVSRSLFENVTWLHSSLWFVVEGGLIGWFIGLAVLRDTKDRY